MEDFTAEELELLDPHPDIHALFVYYNSLYFDDKLGACSGERRCRNWAVGSVMRNLLARSECAASTPLPCSGVEQRTHDAVRRRV